MIEFGRLLETEIPRLRRYPRALTRDPSRADDLVQDTLLRAIAATDPTGGAVVARSRSRSRSNFRGSAADNSPDRSRGHFV